MTITQYTMLGGEKAIHESDITITEDNIKLQCKYVNFGEGNLCFVYLEGICSVGDVYSVKVQRICGELQED